MAQTRTRKSTKTGKKYRLGKLAGHRIAYVRHQVDVIYVDSAEGLERVTEALTRHRMLHLVEPVQEIDPTRANWGTLLIDLDFTARLER